jgi:hypothetical protein
VVGTVQHHARFLVILRESMTVAAVFV